MGIPATPTGPNPRITDLGGLVAAPVRRLSAVHQIAERAALLVHAGRPFRLARLTTSPSSKSFPCMASNRSCDAIVRAQRRQQHENSPRPLHRRGKRPVRGRHRVRAHFSRKALATAVTPTLIYNRMVVDMNLSEADIDRIFHALADRTRRDILGRAIAHEQSVSALALKYDMSFAAVQKHVAVLERAALVAKERRGREQIVFANGPTIAKAIALLDQYEQLWIDRASQIASVLATPDGNGDPE